MYHLNTMLCPIKVNRNTIELTLHTSCFCILTCSVLIIYIFREGGGGLKSCSITREPEFWMYDIIKRLILNFPYSSFDPIFFCKYNEKISSEKIWNFEILSIEIFCSIFFHSIFYHAGFSHTPNKTTNNPQPSSKKLERTAEAHANKA